MPRATIPILRVLVMETVLIGIVFGSAGRVDLPWVWALFAVHAGFMIVAAT